MPLPMSGTHKHTNPYIRTPSQPVYTCALCHFMAPCRNAARPAAYVDRPNDGPTSSAAARLAFTPRYGRQLSSAVTMGVASATDGTSSRCRISRAAPGDSDRSGSASRRRASSAWPVTTGTSTASAAPRAPAAAPPTVDEMSLWMKRERQLTARASSRAACGRMIVKKLALRNVLTHEDELHDKIRNACTCPHYG